jgi:hypothetical protein
MDIANLRYLLLVMTSTEHADADLEALYVNAWGRPWPHQSQKRILNTNIIPTGHAVPIDTNAIALDASESGPVSDDTDHVYGAVAVECDIPDQLSYQCFHGMKMLVKALGITSAISDILVVLEEYVWLCEAMLQGYLQDVRGVVITGHPGIGS